MHVYTTTHLQPLRMIGAGTGAVRNSKTLNLILQTTNSYLLLQAIS